MKNTKLEEQLLIKLLLNLETIRLYKNAFKASSYDFGRVWISRQNAKIETF